MLPSLLSDKGRASAVRPDTRTSYFVGQEIDHASPSADIHAPAEKPENLTVSGRLARRLLRDG
jgi:hypothetical protein